jgi:prepilin-type N-terminal cleavage/methylation domain-containing protein
MRGLQRTNRGFTLTELMVTLLIFIIFVAMGVPSFMAQRQRAALRGVADQTLGFWNAARFEAVKRNTLVKVGVVSNSSGFCLGATTDTPTDGVPCDCMDATACNVARFPGNQAEWRGVTLGSGSTLGPSTEIVVALNPRRGASLTVPADAGALRLVGPDGPDAYALNLSVDRFGRGYLCESASATDKMSDYQNRSCSP